MSPFPCLSSHDTLCPSLSPFLSPLPHVHSIPKALKTCHSLHVKLQALCYCSTFTWNARSWPASPFTIWPTPACPPELGFHFTEPARIPGDLWLPGLAETPLLRAFLSPRRLHHSSHYHVLWTLPHFPSSLWVFWRKWHIGRTLYSKKHGQPEKAWGTESEINKCPFN